MAQAGLKWKWKSGAGAALTVQSRSDFVLRVETDARPNVHGQRHQSNVCYIFKYFSRDTVGVISLRNALCSLKTPHLWNCC